ncbi:DsbC family protein [Sideroxydans sp. CL21]|uniref:DsbC family protein n=1 Tax=Sideroxydans sp. CL21 TaxID=2600596 RepID=UPI0024BD51B9|nr:DsbC family protein [Sideroxydans sp. CL21]
MSELARIASVLIMLSVMYSACGGEQEIRKAITENAPDIKIVSISKSPYAGLYQVVANGYSIFYTDEKGEVGFFGNVVDLKNRQNLTQQEKDKITVIDFSKLPLDKAIVRVKGNGTRKLALFSDPECPYCQGLEKQLEGVNDVTIYTFLLPLAELHPGAMRKAELIWCAKDRAKAWNDMLLLQKEPEGSNTDCQTPIKDIAEIATKNWITGTPGIVFSNGKLLFGNQPTDKIAKMLDASAPQP